MEEENNEEIVPENLPKVSAKNPPKHLADKDDFPDSSGYDAEKSGESSDEWSYRVRYVQIYFLLVFD